MAKASSSKDRPGRIEIQKGPINLDEQFTQGFRTREDTTRRDTRNMDDRRSGQTLTKHEPKR